MSLSFSRTRIGSRWSFTRKISTTTDSPGAGLVMADPFANEWFRGGKEIGGGSGDLEAPGRGGPTSGRSAADRSPPSGRAEVDPLEEGDPSALRACSRRRSRPGRRRAATRTVAAPARSSRSHRRRVVTSTCSIRPPGWTRATAVIELVRFLPGHHQASWSTGASSVSRLAEDPPPSNATAPDRPRGSPTRGTNPPGSRPSPSPAARPAALRARRDGRSLSAASSSTRGAAARKGTPSRPSKARR